MVQELDEKYFALQTEVEEVQAKLDAVLVGVRSLVDVSKQSQEKVFTGVEQMLVMHSEKVQLKAGLYDKLDGLQGAVVGLVQQGERMQLVEMELANRF